MKLVVLPDENAVAQEAAELTVAGLGAAIDTHGEAHFNLTGGSSVVPLYELLARQPWKDALDWRNVHFWWGDDRFVPRDHPESNAGAVYRLLFDVSAFFGEDSGTGASGADVEAGDFPGLRIDADKVHPMNTEGAIAAAAGPDWAATAYETELAQYARHGIDGLPIFDVFLAGMPASAWRHSSASAAAASRSSATFTSSGWSLIRPRSSAWRLSIAATWSVSAWRTASARGMDVQDAIAAAREAFPAWSSRPWQERVAILRRVADIISERQMLYAALVSIEVGKNRLEALGDVEETADLIRWSCDMAAAPRR